MSVYDINSFNEYNLSWIPIKIALQNTVVNLMWQRICDTSVACYILIEP